MTIRLYKDFTPKDDFTKVNYKDQNQEVNPFYHKRYYATVTWTLPRSIEDHVIKFIMKCNLMGYNHLVMNKSDLKIEDAPTLGDLSNNFINTILAYIKRRVDCGDVPLNHPPLQKQPIYNNTYGILHINEYGLKYDIYFQIAGYFDQDVCYNPIISFLDHDFSLDN